MDLSIGKRLMWLPEGRHERRGEVTVVEVRSRGMVVLSNGWTVDRDGYADGTARRPGGRVVELTDGLQRLEPIARGKGMT